MYAKFERSFMILMIGTNFGFILIVVVRFTVQRVRKLNISHRKLIVTEQTLCQIENVCSCNIYELS